LQIEAFLRRRPEGEREPVAAGDGEPPFPPGCVTPAGDLFVRPWLTGTDGAYAARLRRVR